MNNSNIKVKFKINALLLINKYLTDKLIIS
jgi:hypothetical protein